MTKTPIKRHPSLIDLSKDHHFGLLLSWKIRKGKELNVATERVAAYVLHFFENDLEFHFKEEEELLFEKMHSDDPQRIRAEEEHKKMRQLILQIRQEADEKLIDEFSGLLEKHIRFEERELFNHIQETFSNDELDKIKTQLENRERPKTSMYKDAFWLG